jgi:hypothetical protein
MGKFLSSRCCSKFQSLQHFVCIGLITPALILAVSKAGGQTVNDDFNDGTDDGWTRYDPLATGSWALNNGTYRIQSAVSPNPAQLGPARAGSLRTVETYSQFYVSVDIVNWDNNLDQIFGLLARAGTPGLGTTKGYGFTYATRTGRATEGQLELLLISGEAGDDLPGTGSNFTFQANQSYRMVFTGELGLLTGKVYSLTNLVTPIAVLSGSDSSYASGSVGVFTYDNSPTSQHRADTTFDNFIAINLPPVLKIERDHLPYVDVVSSDSCAIGQEAFTVSSMGGDKRCADCGVITYLGPFDAVWEFVLDKCVCVTASSLNIGMSGGPICATAPNRCLIGTMSCGGGEFACEVLPAATTVGAGAEPPGRTVSGIAGCFNVR